MSARDKSEPNTTWKENNGSVVGIPDSFEDMSEYISSLLKTAQIADVQMELSGFGHEDVTLKADSVTNDQIREVTFTVIVSNWHEHCGGQSAYSEQDMVTYRVEEGDDEPDQLMYGTGAFYHKLENRLSDLFGSTQFNRPMFKLDGFDDNAVRYSGSLKLHRYD